MHFKYSCITSVSHKHIRCIIAYSSSRFYQGKFIATISSSFNSLSNCRSSEAEVEIEATSDGLRKRAVTRAALSERIQQIKRKQREAERWNSIKRSLYKPVAVTFGIIICSALAYFYIKN